MKKSILATVLAFLLLAAPSLAQAKIRGGMLGLGIGGSVGFVGGLVGALYNVGSGAVNREWASYEYYSNQQGSYKNARNGKYYTDSGIKYLDAADSADRWMWTYVGVSVVGAGLAVVGFVNMSDGQPSERRSRRQKAQADESGLVPVLDYSNGSLMAMLPDVNLDPVSNKAEARLLRVEF